jgi:hypothetical protein
VESVSIWDIPEVRAVFGLYAGRQPRLVFIGVADSLLERIVKQLVVSDRTADGALVVHPGYVNEIRWWQHVEFADSDAARAAEFVASDVLEPLFSSRRPSSPSARDLASDAQFRERMGALFAGAPSGIATIPTLDAVIDRLDALEAQIARRD